MLKKRKLSNSRFDMTLPDERYRAVLAARELMLEMANPSGKWKRIPKELRLHAIHCLRHYPAEWELDAMSNIAPSMFQRKMDPLVRIVMEYDEDQKEIENGET